MGAAELAATEGEEGEEQALDSRRFAELRERFVGVSDLAGLQGDEVDAHKGASQTLTKVLGLRGGANKHIVIDLEVPTPLIKLLNKLLRLSKHSPDVKLRVGLMAWAIYDKMRRLLNFFVPPPYYEECEDFFRVVAGIHLNVMETVKVHLESAARLGADNPYARDVYNDALKYLAVEIRDGVAANWKNITSSSQSWSGLEAFALRNLADRMAAFADKQLKAYDVQEQSLRNLAARMVARADMQQTGAFGVSGRAAFEADAINVTHSSVLAQAEVPANLSSRPTNVRLSAGKMRAYLRPVHLQARRIPDDLLAKKEFVPAHIQAQTKLKLLGLFASLGHEALFQSAQEALGNFLTNGRLMTIKEFERKMGVDGVRDLVKKLFHKYATPDVALYTYMALYTVGPLRDDPEFFQIFWSLGLLARFLGRHTHHPIMTKVVNYVLYASMAVETAYRTAQFAELADVVAAGSQLTTWGAMVAWHGYLSMFVFFLDGPHHLLK